MNVTVIAENNARILKIRDNGDYFAGAFATRMFQPFKRSDSSKGFPGSGISPGIVKMIVDQHQGEFWAEGIPGRGLSLFQIAKDISG